MHTIRITQRLDSETLYLPQLRQWLGKDIKIVVQEARTESQVAPELETPPRSLVGSVLHYDNPFSPAIEPSEWEANR